MKREIHQAHTCNTNPQIGALFAVSQYAGLLACGRDFSTHS